MASSDAAVHGDAATERLAAERLAATGAARGPVASNRVIAADRAGGAQPWTIGGFDGVGSPAAAIERVRAEHLPTVDEVDAIATRAHDEGYQAGLAEGRDINRRLKLLVGGVSQSIARMEREMADTLVKVAIDLARQVVRESIAVRPELVVPLIGDALAGIARTVDPGAVYVHPADLAIVEEHMGEALAHAGWRPFADEQVERGGCRLEFSGGQVDATLATRWARVMSQLERADAWLE